MLLLQKFYAVQVVKCEFYVIIDKTTLIIMCKVKRARSLALTLGLNSLIVFFEKLF